MQLVGKKVKPYATSDKIYTVVGLTQEQSPNDIGSIGQGSFYPSFIALDANGRFTTFTIEGAVMVDEPAEKNKVTILALKQLMDKVYNLNNGLIKEDEKYGYELCQEHVEYLVMDLIEELSK